MKDAHHNFLRAEIQIANLSETQRLFAEAFKKLEPANVWHENLLLSKNDDFFCFVLNIGNTSSFDWSTYLLTRQTDSPLAAVEKHASRSAWQTGMKRLCWIVISNCCRAMRNILYCSLISSVAAQLNCVSIFQRAKNYFVNSLLFSPAHEQWNLEMGTLRYVTM